MASYPDYHNLRDSLATNASEQKDYDPFRPGYPRFRLLERWGLSPASSRQPQPASEPAQPPAKSVAPTGSASVASASTSAARQAPAPSTRPTRTPSDERLADRISGSRPPGVTYVYVPPEHAPPPPELPTGRRSWISFDSDLWSPSEQPAGRGRPPPVDASRGPAGHRPATAARETARATSRTPSRPTPQPSAPPAYLAQRTHAGHTASQTSASTSASTAVSTPTSAASSTADTNRFSPAGAHVYAYAEPRGGAAPFWCVAYVSGVALAAPGGAALVEEYTVLRLRAPSASAVSGGGGGGGGEGCGGEGCNREVRRADEPFAVGGRTLALAALKRKGLGWLAPLQLARLRALADGLALRGGESYQQWVYDLYCDACDEGLFEFDESTERRMVRGPVR